MGLTEKMVEVSNNLAEIEAQNNALLQFANETTGGRDERLGDAIRALAEGFGGGGDSNFELFYETEITHDIATGPTSSKSIPLDLPDWSTQFTDINQCMVCIIEDKSGEKNGHLLKTVSFAGFPYSARYSTYNSFGLFVAIYQKKKDGSYGYIMLPSDSSSTGGIFPSSFSINPSRLYVRVKYNDYSGNIDGTYSLKLYKLTIPV